MKIGHRDGKSQTEVPAKHARGMKLHDIGRAMGSRSGMGLAGGHLRVRANARDTDCDAVAAALRPGGATTTSSGTTAAWTTGRRPMRDEPG